MLQSIEGKSEGADGLGSLRHYHTGSQCTTEKLH